MTDRLSSSRGDRSPDRSHPRRSARDQHATTWDQQPDSHNRQTDQQASTSHTNPRPEGQRGGTTYREAVLQYAKAWYEWCISQYPRGTKHNDEYQKRFEVYCCEMEDYLKNKDPNNKELQNEFEDTKRSFTTLKTKEARDEFIEKLETEKRNLQAEIYNDNETIEIDKKLGYLLKSQSEKLKNVSTEKLKDVRMSVLDFLKEKIENESDKKKTFQSWSIQIDGYCMDHKNLVTDNTYANVTKDMQLCLQSNRDEIANKESEDGYKGENAELHQTIQRINESLYTEHDREQNLRREHEEQERQNSEDLLVQEREGDLSQSSLSPRANSEDLDTDHGSFDNHSSTSSHEALHLEQALRLSLQDQPSTSSHEDSHLEQALRLSLQDQPSTSSHEDSHLEQALRLSLQDQPSTSSHEASHLEQALRLSLQDQPSTSSYEDLHLNQATLESKAILASLEDLHLNQATLESKAISASLEDLHLNQAILDAKAILASLEDLYR